MTAAHPLRIWKVLGALVEADVAFLVIGGVAVAAHGFERGTKDVDIVPDPEPANVERLHRALSQLGAESLEVGDFRPEEMPYRWSAEGLAQGGNWALMTRYGRVDVMQYVAGILEDTDDYYELAERALVVPTSVGRIAFVSYEDLLRMKYAAGRDQDLIDIRALREARGELE